MSFDTGIIAERKIREAIDEGKFDDLPGKGRPLNLDDDPTTPPHLRLANKVLKNAGVPPEWMQVDQDIDREREECRRIWQAIERDYTRRRQRVDSTAGGAARDAEGERFAAWHSRERTKYLRAVKRVNHEILKLNCSGPRAQRVHIPMNVAAEAGRFDSAFPAHPDYAPADITDSSRDAARIRDAAISIYRFDDGKVR